MDDASLPAEGRFPKDWLAADTKSPRVQVFGNVNQSGTCHVVMLAGSYWDSLGVLWSF